MVFLDLKMDRGLLSPLQQAIYWIKHSREKFRPPLLFNFKGLKMTFYEIVTADNKNAIETPFFAILSPQKGMEGFVIDI